MVSHLSTISALRSFTSECGMGSGACFVVWPYPSVTYLLLNPILTAKVFCVDSEAFYVQEKNGKLQSCYQLYLRPIRSGHNPGCLPTNQDCCSHITCSVKYANLEHGRTIRRRSLSICSRTSRCCCLFQRFFG